MDSTVNGGGYSSRAVISFYILTVYELYLWKLRHNFALKSRK